MGVRELDIAGAWEITPQLHADSRGLFFEWLTDRAFAGFAGHRLDVRQANCSVSAAGVLRGLHFAQLPPSQAKYVTCLSGSVFDVVVDIRMGSPTFGDGTRCCLTTATTERSTSPKASRMVSVRYGRLDGDVSVLVGIQPATRAHHRPDRPGAGDRLAERTTSWCCPTATPPHPLWTRSAPPVCCRVGRRPRRLFVVCLETYRDDEPLRRSPACGDPMRSNANRLFQQDR